MAVPSVFVSSVMTGFEAVREQTAVAIHKMGMHALLAERQPANPASSRQAMFEALGRSEYYLLLLGERYGEPGDSGKSPTEEEYEEARRLGRPVLALVQRGITMEATQQEFLGRVRGDWGEGVFHDRFDGPDDVGLAVASALNAQVTRGAEDIPAAQERATELARGEDQRGGLSSGVRMRIAFVPVRQTTLLDAVALERPDLEPRLAEMVRGAELVPQRIGIETATSAAGIRLDGTQASDWTPPEVVVGADGSISAVVSVRGEGTFGGQLVDPKRVEAGLGATGRFAIDAWDLIDGSGQIDRVAICVAIPDAEYKAFGSISGSSMSMSQSLPMTVIAPQPPIVVARGQVADGSVISGLVAEVRRVFQDAGAVQA